MKGKGAYNLAQKLIASHLASGEMTPGAEIALHIDQTLSQDALGTLCYLQFEAIGVPFVPLQSGSLGGGCTSPWVLF